MFDAFCLITGSLPPAYQRSLLVLSTAMVMFAAKLYHITETHNLLNFLLESDVSVRYLCFYLVDIYACLLTCKEN